MKTRNHKTSVVIALVASLALSACGGCSSSCDSSDSGRLKLHPIYESMLWGALIGGIIGHQSDEAGNGAALGAGVFGLGTLLQQTDKMPHEREEPEHKPEEQQEVVVQIPNDNGSLTPVVLKREDGDYVGPNGEYYKRLPTAEQLKPIYGL